MRLKQKISTTKGDFTNFTKSLPISHPTTMASPDFTPTASSALGSTTNLVLGILKLCLAGLYNLCRVFVQAVLGVLLFLFADSLLTQLGWFRLVPDGDLRKPHANYHHGFRPKTCSKDFWGGKTVDLCTNSLGFRDERIRKIERIPDKHRLLVIGDSFTEGIGLDWGETFVGILANSHRHFDILNAAVVSYSPIIYFNKIRFLIEKGFTFHDVLVFIDISDMQDEAYYYDENGEIKNKHYPTNDRILQFKLFVKKTLWATTFLVRRFKELGYVLGKKSWGDGDPRQTESFNHRAAWTIADWSKIDSAYNGSVQRSIQSALANMDKLHRLLVAHDIRLSVGVYPWPLQLAQDVVRSRQVVIWEEWCRGKCRYFVNTFPRFFEYAASHEDWYSKL
ncbi:MAG: hypothetical protein OEN50_20740, partial [Deltaproteobacteria bacterium]|nr:hypothetical protein [Deltaproteobacteria bacterium]